MLDRFQYVTMGNGGKDGVVQSSSVNTQIVDDIAQQIHEDILEDSDDPEIQFQARSILQPLLVIEEQLGEKEPAVQ